MCTGRYDRRASVVSVSTASRTRRTSPVVLVRRSFPGGPQARTAARLSSRSCVSDKRAEALAQLLLPELEEAIEIAERDDRDPVEAGVDPASDRLYV